MNKASYQFCAGEPVPRNLSRIASALIGSTIARIEQPSRNRAEDLHQVRLTLKWLRSVYRLIRPVISPLVYEPETAQLKQAAERLAFSRDATVARQTLEKIAKSEAAEIGAACFAALREGLAERSPQKESAAQREEALQNAAADLRKAERAWRHLNLSQESWPALEPGLLDVYRKARRGLARAGQKGRDEDFHGWRREAKYLYYLLLMLEPVWPKRLAKKVKRLNLLQNRLGADHDVVLLKRFLLDLPRGPGSGTAVDQVLPCLSRRSRELRRECLALGEKLFREKSRKFVERLGARWRVWLTPE